MIVYTPFNGSLTYKLTVSLSTLPVFFFQAEVGIRAGHVTGVQTCALPIFTAYNGDFSFFDVDANSMRSVAGMDRQEVTQQVRQENWSHRFHYGIDQRLGNGTDLSFYGQINPHSFEQNGSLLSDLTSTASARRRERDRALGTYHAATLNHRCDDEQRHQKIGRAHV